MNAKLFIVALVIALIAMTCVATTTQLDEYIYEAEEIYASLLEESLQATYTVKSGDNLSTIASKNGCTVAQLQSLNNIANANLIKVGQVLTLCSSGGSSSGGSSSGSSGSCGSMSEAGWSYLKSTVFTAAGDQKTNTALMLNAASQQGITMCTQLAYLLATAYHESILRPVKEAFWLSEDWRKNNLRYYPYYGRGFVQLTWDYNYKKLGQALGYGDQFVNSPDMIMDPAIAAKIIAYGMKNGSYTGKKLSDYINGSSTDYLNARRIINGTDKQDLIKGYALHFEAALRK